MPKASRLIVSIALKHLRSRRRQTLLATLGVGVGGAIFALMLAITIGQQTFLNQRLIDVSPHLIVTGDRLEPTTNRNLIGNTDHRTVELRVNTAPTERSELKPYTEMVARVERIGSPVVAVAPYVAFQGVLRNGTRFQTVEMRGVDPVREQGIARLAASIRRGRLADLSGRSDAIIIGNGLARKLNVGIGGSVVFVAPSGTRQSCAVVAVFESGVAAVDDRRCYVNLALAQSLRGMQRNAVTGLSVQLGDAAQADQVRPLAEVATGYHAETWEQTNAQILAFQTQQRVISQLLVAFVFVTSAFGIANMLVAIVLQKKEDIAVMKSFGMSRRMVARIFLLEGVAIGIMGGVVAVAVGYGFATVVGMLRLFPKSETAYLRFDTFPVSSEPWIFLLTFGISVVMASLAALLPARRAARVIPVQVIRGDA